MNRSITIHKALILCFGLSSLALLASPVTAAESTLIVYAESSFLDSRLVETADGDSVEGYASDLVRTLLLQSGYTADIRIVPWARLMQSLQTEPNVLGFNLTRTPEREERFHWIGMIRPVSFRLWGLKERAGELPRSLEEARALRISAYYGDVVEQYLLSKDFTNLVHVSDNYDGLSMLQRRRIDLMPYSQTAMDDFMSRSASARDALAPIIDLDEISTAHYLVMSNNSDPELVEQLKASFQSLIDSGDYDEILGN